VVIAADAQTRMNAQRIPRTETIADPLTKPLMCEKHARFVKMLYLADWGEM
jgi:hypothetical protein